MKKKIKRLTLKDVKKLCSKYSSQHCVGCPLTCFKGSTFQCIYTINQREVEINESNND